MPINSTDIETRSVDKEVDDLDGEGMHGTFDAKADAHVHCNSCNHDIDARDAQVLEVRRLEGSSDPSEMAAVVGLRCPRCHVAGTLVVSFGPTASADDQDVMAALSA